MAEGQRRLAMPTSALVEFIVAFLMSLAKGNFTLRRLAVA
jgi:hypothetical protein